jgi:hypothetical protein
MMILLKVLPFMVSLKVQREVSPVRLQPLPMLGIGWTMVASRRTSRGEKPDQGGLGWGDDDDPRLSPSLPGRCIRLPPGLHTGHALRAAAGTGAGSAQRSAASGVSASTGSSPPPGM